MGFVSAGRGWAGKRMGWDGTGEGVGMGSSIKNGTDPLLASINPKVAVVFVVLFGECGPERVFEKHTLAWK